MQYSNKNTVKKQTKHYSMKKLFFFFFALMQAQIIFAQSGGINGKITNKSEIPLPYVNIIIEGTNFNTITNERGEYEINNIPEGKHQIIVSLISYQSVKQEVFIKSNEVINVSIQLQDNIVEMQSVDVYGTRAYIARLPEIRGTDIYSGKKNEVVLLDGMNINTVQNGARNVFARIPGITAWELDGSGTQISVASRGLSPHRSWEFNVNQNGYNVNNDLYGYPEAMYNPPLEAVSQIEVVRGSAALQYGPQFGGMLNYVIKKPDTTKIMSTESQQTYGSFNMFNSFNAIGGKAGKFTYYAYFNYRTSDGWRPNSNYNFLNTYVSIHYKPTSKIDIGIEYSRENYVQKFAGGLTDSMFAANPRQSTRSRNYFNPMINLPALLFDYNINKRTKINVKAYSFFGQRNMVVANPALATNADTLNRKLGSYSAREINRDYYNSYTIDARLIHKYNLFNHESAVSGGIKYSNISTDRKQNGEGTTGIDFDLTRTGEYGINLLFRTINYGMFLENLFRITNKLSITPGIRYDNLNSTLSGTEYKVYKDYRPVSLSTSRNILLAGAGAQYKITNTIDFYGNYSQAYRPILYSSLIIGATTAVIDPHLKDAQGYNTDIGIRGKIKHIVAFDVSTFQLYYGNRIGNVTLTDNKGKSYAFTTNVGNALIRGIEAFVEIHFLNFKTEHANSDFSIFSTYSYNDARYLNGTIGTTNLKGHILEDVPQFISRSGLNCTIKNISATFYYSAVGRAYSDANNTITPKTDPSFGYIPAYQLMDFALEYKFLKKYNIRVGVNNLADNKYFTRRTTTLVYLGKGILPGDGRSFYFTFGIKL